ncbi:MAG: NUDIX domain-containing protein [Candidatus Aminicenantales bacterium]
MKKKTSRLKVSAGLLMYRFRSGQLQVFLVHPGGPFWAKKDEGAWSIPKGEIEENEVPLEAAIREFEEEIGIKPGREFLDLGSIKQRGGKTVYAWAFAGDYDEAKPVKSNTFTLEFPPHSGKIREFPEIDKAAFFEVEEAKRKINSAQAEFIDRLEKMLRAKVKTR